MPSTAVRSYRASGMKKTAEAGSESNGNVASHGLKEDYNSTYPTNEVDRDDADSAPINREFAMKLPDKIEPLGSVDLGQVSLGGKK